MLGNAFGWPHLLIILAIILLFFGAPKLPGLARSLGQSMRIFKGEMKNMKDEPDKRSDAAVTTGGEDTAAPKPADTVPSDDASGSASETRPKP
jgi:sec-independent protein translocase protein TatA